MNNPLSRYFNDRFIQPAIEKALSDGSPPPAFGVSHAADVSLAQSIGQPHDANYSLLYSLYKLNTDVSGAVNKWVGGVTGPGWRITTMSPDTKMTDALRKEAEEVERWLKNPNPHKLFALMIQEGIQHQGIVGNFYWYVSSDRRGRPLEIWPMHPALTKVVANDKGERLGYVMQPRAGNPVHFETDEVLDFPLPNPTSDLYGESPLELVLEEAGIDLMALRSNKAIFQNALKPSAVVLMDETAKREDAEAMKAMLNQSHSGAANQHKVAFLSKTRDFKPWTVSHRDLEFLELRKLSTSKVARAYRLPLVLMGEHNTGDYATTKFLIRDTYNHVYRPMQEVISSIITERLIHRFNPELRFELIKPDASDPDDIRKDQMAAKSFGILTADEVRDDSFGKEPLQGSDDTQQQEAPTVEEKKPDTDAADHAEDAPTTAEKSFKKALDADDLVTIAQLREAEMEALSQPLVAPVAAFLDTQARDYADSLPDDLTEQSLDPYIEQKSDAYDTVLITLLAALLLQSLYAGSSTAQLQVGFTLTAGQTNPYINDYLHNQLATRVTGINQHTRERLRTILQAGIQAGDTQAQLKARIEGLFEEFQGYRAKLIADNEVTSAYSHANKAALDIMFKQGAISHRMWLTAQDDRVRLRHQELHGYTIRYDAKFPDELEPGEDINCRCTQIGLTPEQAEAYR